MYATALIVFLSFKELIWPHCDHQGELLIWLRLLMRISNPFPILIMLIWCWSCSKGAKAYLQYAVWLYHLHSYVFVSDFNGHEHKEMWTVHGIHLISMYNNKAAKTKHHVTNLISRHDWCFCMFHLNYLIIILFPNKWLFRKSVSSDTRR